MGEECHSITVAAHVFEDGKTAVRTALDLRGWRIRGALGGRAQGVGARESL
jgi:hypothetical protein